MILLQQDCQRPTARKGVMHVSKSHKRLKNFNKRPNHCQKILCYSQDRGKVDSRQRVVTMLTPSCSASAETPRHHLALHGPSTVTSHHAASCSPFVETPHRHRLSCGTSTVTPQCHAVPLQKHPTNTHHRAFPLQKHPAITRYRAVTL